jgi:NADH dehydrogenase subunit 5
MMEDIKIMTLIITTAILIWEIFKWRSLIKIKFELSSFIFWENLISAGIVALFSWFLWYWTLFNEYHLFSSGYITIALILTIFIIIFISKMVIFSLRKSGVKIKTIFCILTTIMEILVFVIYPIEGIVF